jgi:undecaprenyl-diphosphatase
MPLWQVIVLGVVQGLTEFLPISSTAHLIIAQRLFGRSIHDIKDDPFTIGIQLGTLVAVAIYFHGDFRKMIVSVYKDLYHNQLFRSRNNDSRVAKLIVLGTIPVVVCGLLFKKMLESYFYNPMSIGIVAIVFALLMLLSEWWSRRLKSRGLTLRNESQITLFDALWIGAFQCLALMPGGSRSGTTISAGLFAGLDRAAAARFSFLLSFPAVLGAGLYDLFKKRKELMDTSLLLSLGVGLVVSAIVGYFCIHWLIGFLKKYSTNWFVLYRVVFGVILILLALKGWFPTSD